MKVFLLLVAYSVVSGLVGLVVCSWLFWKSKGPRATAFAALIFFGGPLAACSFLMIQDNSERKQYEEDVAYVKELCTKYGGDKIFRTVSNVEGVFQMRARNPSRDQLQDQLGMFDPWGFAQDDRDSPAMEFGYSGMRYRYMEMQPGYGQKEGPPFRRKVAIDTGRIIGEVTPNALPEKHDEAIWEPRIFTVTKLRSRYGYLTEDISTPDMRKRWIAGGRIKIVDLQTNEVLAERVGYFRAIGSSAVDHWSGASAYQSQRICPHNSTLGTFLLSVLKPLPPQKSTRQEAEALTKD